MSFDSILRAVACAARGSDGAAAARVSSADTADTSAEWTAGGIHTCIAPHTAFLTLISVHPAHTHVRPSFDWMERR